MIYILECIRKIWRDGTSQFWPDHLPVLERCRAIFGYCCWSIQAWNPVCQERLVLFDLFKHGILSTRRGWFSLIYSSMESCLPGEVGSLWFIQAWNPIYQERLVLFDLFKHGILSARRSWFSLIYMI